MSITLRCAIVCLMSLLAIALQAEPSSSAPNWEEQYKRAEWVSRVRIESVGSIVNPALSLPRLVAVQGYRYNASVIKGWKGEQKGTIRFQMSLSDCHQALDVDREYVVFGSSDFRGGLQSDSCEDIVAVDRAEQLLSALDKLSQSPVKSGS